MAPTRTTNAADRCWCKLPDSSAMVECTICGYYIHYKCMGITIDELEDLICEADASYACKACLPKLTKAKRIELAQNSSSGRVFAYHVEESDSLSRQKGSGFDKDLLDFIISTATKAATQAAIACVSEMMEKKEKKHNLVIVGMPETKNSTAQQNQADRDMILKYFDHLNIEHDSLADNFRDGLKPSNSRIIKVLFNRGFSGHRLKFLRGFRHAVSADTGLSGLRRPPFIRPDMTYSEREKDRKLRDEARRRREGGENCVVRGGEIVTRDDRPPQHSGN